MINDLQIFIRFFLKIILLFVYNTLSIAQTNVTRVYTDHSGFFTSSTSNPISVDVATHHLLAFQTGSTIWSTGVNDAILTANAVNFTPQVFQAMPATVFGNNSGALIGLGRLFGGYSGGDGCAPPVSPPHGNNVSSYITDGINGLNLSTAVFNLGGNIYYTVASIDVSSIGDGVPDIIITQAGDVNAAISDRFRFLDASNNIVGAAININFASVPAVIKPTWKFYTINGLNCGASGASSRDMRILTFDFADLGITNLNYQDVTQFQHQLTPNTDIAFVGYNQQSIDILPIALLSFKAKLINNQVYLNWQTVSEINNDYFTVERSKDLKNWEKVLTKPGFGNSNFLIDYDAIDYFPLSGISYYRLKQTDYNGSTSYSDIEVINNNSLNINIYPNPANEYLNIDIGANKNNESMLLMIRDMTGNTIMEQIINHSDKVRVDFLAKGIYHVELKNDIIRYHQKLVIQ